MGNYFGDYARYASIGLSWVLLSLLYVYVGYRVGGWLDGRWGLYPAGTVLCVVVAVVLSIASLIKQVLEIDRRLSRSKKPDGNEP